MRLDARKPAQLIRRKTIVSSCDLRNNHRRLAKNRAGARPTALRDSGQYKEIRGLRLPPPAAGDGLPRYCCSYQYGSCLRLSVFGFKYKTI
jgi:hypothetical protein